MRRRDHRCVFRLGQQGGDRIQTLNTESHSFKWNHDYDTETLLDHFWCPGYNLGVIFLPQNSVRTLTYDWLLQKQLGEHLRSPFPSKPPLRVEGQS